ncbi:hypothetical protein [Streptomyces sp. NPDC050564]|uniref:hypothetical protein n=1 Tax=Streptomyces sp. NPDC050564 TaxID=3365631 RepID=UPI0037BD6D9C
MALLDADGEFIASGSYHGRTDIAWERGRFGNNLEVADPERLLVFLERHAGRSLGPPPGGLRTLPG